MQSSHLGREARVVAIDPLEVEHVPGDAAGWLWLVGGRDHDHGLDPLGMSAREAQSGDATHRQAHEPDPLEAQAVQEGGQVVDETGAFPAMCGVPARGAVGTCVGHEEAVVLAQQRSLCAPVARPDRGGTVEEHECRSVAFVLVVDEQAVRGDVRHAGLAAASASTRQHRRTAGPLPLGAHEH